MNSPRDAGTADWTSLDQLIDELVGLSRASLSCDGFYRELLPRVVEGLSAAGASVWELDDGAAVLRLHRDALGRMSTDGRAFIALQPAAAWSLAHCEALALPPHGDDGDETLPANATAALLLVQPIVVDESPVGVIVVQQRGDGDAQARRGALHFLATVADLAADHRRNFERAHLRRSAQEADRLDGLLSATYEHIDLRRVAYAVANDGAGWCGADRLSVLIVEGDSTRLVAATGVDEADRRADSVRKLERLAASVAAQGRSIAYPDDLAALAPQVTESLAAYVETTDCKRVRVVLLRHEDDAAEARSAPDAARGDQRPFAALVFEQFAETSAAATDQQIDTLQKHAARALRKALDVESIPLGRMWLGLKRRRGSIVRKVRTGAIIAAGLAVVFAATFLIPATRWSEASGVMVPQERREIYAPTDAVVDEILVRHGDVVAAGTLLLQLRKPELDLEQARVLGELQTAQRRLAALRSTRTSVLPTDAAQRLRRQELAAEEEQLGETIRSAERQLELLKQQQVELEVRAPIAGRLTTWDPEALLAGRPVKAGERLLRLADETSDWLLELDVPQRGYADVAGTMRNAEPAAVEFVVAAGPEHTYHGKLKTVATAAETSTAGATQVAAVATFHRDDVPSDLRKPGAIVSGRIDCGPSSLGTEWTRDFLHYLRTRWWF
ncbi:MAG: HlyD family efflux transporter periplasmic adaptor subunit [Planctomycetales bacterium]|nr:HlyD family efflux transporter periplasmic adaptor subunit [Planctomycetales bacterium]